MNYNSKKKDMKIRKLAFICFTFLLSAGCSVGIFLSWPQLILDYFMNRKLEILEPSDYHCALSSHSGCDQNNLVAEKFTKSDAPPSDYKGTSISLRYKQRLPVNSDVKREAVAALHVALDLQNQGKTEKAMKVFQHAVALDPSHADILTAYGEFLESHVKDVVKADHLYKIALEHCPDHGRALQNRKRTGPIVEEIDQVRFSRVDRKRSYLYTIPHNNPALRRAKREAYFAHIYHTNAIEGNTLTLSQTRSIVETRMAVGGKSLREQNEVLGLDSALSYINSTLVGHIGKLTLKNILDIHLRVLGYVDPTEAGRFRNTQVYVGDFIPPPASELPEHMDQLIEWLNSEEAQSLHPVEFAALAHYRLVAIHPFYDGNGRTSRLLMNLILMQAGFPPVSIEVHDRLYYYETLEQANNGDIRPFIRFIAECTERTLDEYISVIVEDDSELSLPPSFKRRRPSSSKDRVIYIELDDDDNVDGGGGGGGRGGKGKMNNEDGSLRNDISLDGASKCHDAGGSDSGKCDIPVQSDNNNNKMPPYL